MAKGKQTKGEGNRKNSALDGLRDVQGKKIPKAYQNLLQSRESLQESFKDFVVALGEANLPRGAEPRRKELLAALEKDFITITDDGVKFEEGTARKLYDMINPTLVTYGGEYESLKVEDYKDGLKVVKYVGAYTAALKSALDLATGAKNIYKVKVDELKEKVEGLQDQVKDMTKEIEDLKARSESQVETINELDSQLVVANRRFRRVRKIAIVLGIAAIAFFGTTLGHGLALGRSQNAYKAELDDNATLEQQIEDLNSKLDRADAKIAELQLALNEAGDVTQLRAELEAAKQERDQAKADLEAAQKELASRQAKIDELNTQNDYLSSQVTSLGNSVKTLTDKNLELLGTIEQNQQTISELQEQLKNANAEEVEKLKAEIKSLETENASLKDQVATTNSNYESALAELKQAQADKADVQSQLATAQEELATAQKELAAAQESLRDAQANNAELQEKVTDAENRVKDLQAQLDAAKAERDLLQQQYDEAQDIIDRLFNENGSQPGTTQPGSDSNSPVGAGDENDQNNGRGESGRGENGRGEPGDAE